jgi:hypothetical protein
MKIPFQGAKIKTLGGSTTCALTQRGYMEKKCTSTCDICNIIQCECIVQKCQFISLIDTWTSIICLVNDSMWHHPNCLKGKCD